MNSSLAGARLALDLRRMWKTGIGRYSRALAAGLPLVLPDAELFAIVNDERDAEYLTALAPQFSPVVVPAPQYSPREVLRTALIERRLDLWHSPNPYQLALDGRVPVILSILDLIQVHHPIGMRNRLASLPMRELLRHSTRRATHLIAISQATAEAFVTEFALPREKITVTPLAADGHLPLDVGDADVAELRNRIGSVGPFVLFVGMLQPHKNLARLIDALSMVRDRVPHALLVVGQFDDTSAMALKARAEAVGFHDRLHILAHASDRELAAAYASTDLLILPSIQEGFGLPLVEAMRFGAPCAASDRPVMREVAGDAAVYFDPFDVNHMARVIEAILSDETHRRRLSSNATSRTHLFNWSITARNTAEAYARALRTGS